MSADAGELSGFVLPQALPAKANIVAAKMIIDLILIAVFAL